MTTNFSLFDLLLDRDDPSLNLGSELKEEQDVKPDILEMALKDSEMSLDWVDPTDDFLESLLHGEQLCNPAMLDPMDSMDALNHEHLDDSDFGQAGSSGASDSGLSSEMSMEQQLSPMPMGLSPLPPSSESVTDSDGEVDSSSLLRCANMGDVQMKDNQTVIRMQVIRPEKREKRMAQVIRVTPVSSTTESLGNRPRSILLPVSTLKDGKNVRTIRIISAGSGTKLPPGLRMVCKPPVQTPTLSSTSVDRSSSNNSDSGSDDSDGSQYPRLELSVEEKRLLKKEGIALPTHFPLTKMEERELKRIRRKIRNKISAQDSRKRKKEYVDGLEDRVQRSTEENHQLQKRIKMLQGQNVSLTAQVRRLQAMLTQGGNTSRPVQPATCLMVLLLSLALVVVPNLRPGHTNTSAVEDSADLAQPTDKLPPVAGRSRTLLYKYPVCSEELPFNMDEEGEELCTLHDHDYEPPSKVARGRPPTGQSRSALPHYQVDSLGVDDVWPPPKAPPDSMQYPSISPSLDKHWLSNSLEAAMGDMRPNSTAENHQTRSVLLKMSTEK